MSEIKEYRYEAGKCSFSILNLGCALTSLCVPDRDGVVRNVVLPYVGWKENPNVIFDTKANFGLTVGRFANRIKGSAFELDGKRYSFVPNEGGNLLHSGKDSMRFRFWDVRHEKDGFTCHLLARHEEDGFPGDLEVWVRFSLTSNGVFSIHYKACPTEDCPVNLTNHAYFNLTGDPSILIKDHEVVFDSSSYVEQDDENIPTGRIIASKGSCFDFTFMRPMGQVIDACGGVDMANLIDRPFGQKRGYSRFCQVREPLHGIVMDCHTDMPAFHFYAGGSIKGECGYQSFAGFCLETEFVPDCVNQPSLGSCTVKAGELFESTTTYAFRTDRPCGLCV